MPPPRLGVERVERERRLARAGHPDDGGQPGWQRHGDVAEVVLGGALDPDPAGPSGHPPISRSIAVSLGAIPVGTCQEAAVAQQVRRAADRGPRHPRAIRDRDQVVLAVGQVQDPQHRQLEVGGCRCRRSRR